VPKRCQKGLYEIGVRTCAYHHSFVVYTAKYKLRKMLEQEGEIVGAYVVKCDPRQQNLY